MPEKSAIHESYKAMWIERNALANLNEEMAQVLKAVLSDYSSDTPDTNGCEEPSLEKARAVLAKASSLKKGE